MRVANKSQIAEQVLDFGALVKAETANHGVGDVVATKRLLDQTGLGVGAVENGALPFSGALRFGRSRLTKEGLDAVGDKERLVFAVRGLVVADQRCRPGDRSIASCPCAADCWRRQRRQLPESPASSGSSVPGGRCGRWENPSQTRECCGCQRRARSKCSDLRRPRRRHSLLRRPAASSARIEGGWCPGTRRRAGSDSGAGSARALRWKP